MARAVVVVLCLVAALLTQAASSPTLAQTVSLFYQEETKDWPRLRVQHGGASRDLERIR